MVDGELAYFMDFYTHNPAHYYPTRFSTSPPKTESDVTYVDVVDSAAGQWRADPDAVRRDAQVRGPGAALSQALGDRLGRARLVGSASPTGAAERGLGAAQGSTR